MKRKFITFLRVLRAGGQSFVRNATLAIAAMAVMVITLTIVLFSLIANATFTNTITLITNKIDVSVYLKDTVTTEQSQKLVADLQKESNVKSVDFLSKDQALEEYKKQNAANTDLLMAISQTDNPLPATVRIKPNDPNRINEIKQFLEKPENAALYSETSYSDERKEAIDKIAKAARFFTQAGIAAVAVFMVVAIMIIFNTIRMAIFNRRDELTIMRLLGASTWYIRGPYVVETVLYGIIAAAISVALCNSLFVVSARSFEASSFGLLDITYANNFFASNFWKILGAQMLIGIVIGVASSLIATRRYLKFKTSK